MVVWLYINRKEMRNHIRFSKKKEVGVSQYYLAFVVLSKVLFFKTTILPHAPTNFGIRANIPIPVLKWPQILHLHQALCSPTLKAKFPSLRVKTIDIGAIK